MVQILCFSAPVRFRGHFEQITIAKGLLNTKPRRVGKLSVFRRLRKCGGRKKYKKTAVKYNGSLALAIARAGDHNKLHCDTVSGVVIFIRLLRTQLLNVIVHTDP